MRVGRSLCLAIAACIAASACSKVEEPAPGPRSDTPRARANATGPLRPGIRV
jgi:hypothetical protein